MMKLTEANIVIRWRWSHKAASFCLVLSRHLCRSQMGPAHGALLWLPLSFPNGPSPWGFALASKVMGVIHRNPMSVVCRVPCRNVTIQKFRLFDLLTHWVDSRDLISMYKERSWWYVDIMCHVYYIGKSSDTLASLKTHSKRNIINITV